MSAETWTRCRSCGFEYLPLLPDPAALCGDCVVTESRLKGQDTRLRFLTDLAALKSVPLDVPADVLATGSLS